MCNESVALLQINCNPIAEQSHPLWIIRNKQLTKMFLICLDVFLILMSDLLMTTTSQQLALQIYDQLHFEFFMHTIQDIGASFVVNMILRQVSVNLQNIFRQTAYQTLGNLSMIPFESVYILAGPDQMHIIIFYQFSCMDNQFYPS